VKWAKDEIIVYDGPKEFINFIDDIYNEAKTRGGEFCLFNAKPENWINLMGEESYNLHSQRMAALSDKLKVKITSKKGNNNFISKSFAEYRWVPEEMFNAKSFYAYGDKIAFMSFDNDNVNNSRILVLNHPEFSQGFKILFNIAWENVAEIPKE